MSIRERNLRFHFENTIRKRDEIIRKKDELMQAYRDYLSFICDEYEQALRFCIVHSQIPSKEVVMKGLELRTKIKKLEDEKPI